MNKRLAWSIFRYVSSLLVVLIVGVSILLWWALGQELPSRSNLPIDPVKATQIAPAPDFITAVSYNIGHGQGVKVHAWDYRNKEVTEHQLTMLADAMTAMNADILFLQEVDLDANRTFRINQIDFIKNKTKHPYHACAVVWEKNYVPFPYWPPSHHIGHVKAANCILSKFPLSNQQRLIFEKPASNPFWYNWGYIDRGLQRVDVDIGGNRLALLNIHLEAWDKKTRENQIKVALNYIKEIDLPVIFAGDFNTVLPGAKKTSNFADDVEVDFANENTLTWFIDNTSNLKTPFISDDNQDPFDLYTFPSNLPDRRLDHIFLVGNSLSFIDYRVVKEAGMASDHLPVMAKIKYKD